MSQIDIPDEPETLKSERAKTLHRVVTGPVGEPWDASMLAVGAWSDPMVPLIDRVDERRKQLLAERETARDEFKTVQAHLLELELKIQQLTGAIHIIDELVDVMLLKSPKEPKA